MPPDKNLHFWQFEYYSDFNPDVECIRASYRDLPFHLVTIKDNIYMLADDICRFLNIPDDTGVWLMDRIPASTKTTEKMNRSNGEEFELALLTEEGLCRFIELINTPEAYDFLADVQKLLRQKGDPDTDVVARIAEQFAQAKRRRIEADPNRLQPLDIGISRVLSAPSLYRGRLDKHSVQPASVLTIAALVSMKIYQDADGNLWFDTSSVLKALGHSSVADPATVFKDVPPCWIADVEAEDSEGNITTVTCILLQGILFYLSDSTNLYSVYLMYYIALQTSMRNKDNPKYAVDSMPLITKRLDLGEGRAEEKRYVRWLMDRSGTQCYLLDDILKVISVEKDEADRVLQNIPVKFKKMLLIKVKAESEYAMCVSEQGLWFLLSAFRDQPSAQEAIQKLADLQPDTEDSLNLSRVLNGWDWPYITDSSQIPPYDALLRGLDVILSSYNRQNLTECGFWGLNALAEMTTGISPLTIIQRWESNKKKEAEHFEEKDADS